MCLVMKIMLLVIALRFKKLVDLFLNINITELMQVLHKWRSNCFLKLLFCVNTRLLKHMWLVYYLVFNVKLYVHSEI